MGAYGPLEVFLILVVKGTFTLDPVRRCAPLSGHFTFAAPRLFTFTAPRLFGLRRSPEECANQFFNITIQCHNHREGTVAQA